MNVWGPFRGLLAGFLGVGNLVEEGGREIGKDKERGVLSTGRAHQNDAYDRSLSGCLPFECCKIDMAG